MEQTEAEEKKNELPPGLADGDDGLILIAIRANPKTQHLHMQTDCPDMAFVIGAMCSVIQGTLPTINQMQNEAAQFRVLAQMQQDAVADESRRNIDKALGLVHPNGKPIN